MKKKSMLSTCFFTLGVFFFISCGDDDKASDDDVATECTNDNTTNLTNVGCSTQPTISNEYEETVAGDIRTIVTNTYPNHSFSVRQGASVTEFDRTYNLDLTPTLASGVTSILNDQNRPRYYTGVAKNGIPLDPAPAEPFIFENTSTGEYNWDWVFEPTNNQTDVNLDCNTAHVGPFGYHYHGDMAEYADILLAGIGTGTTVPENPVQVGWGADGFPVLYKYGPNANGTLTELTPSYKLKDGERSGDGISEPCGTYSGKYTEDYEYQEGLGDLDECNGIEQTVTLGGEAFDYFYVITDDFPVIGRCISGTPDTSFTK